MRHRVAGRHLSRTSEHRLALRRNLVASLIEHETISTTIAKAKEVQSFAERLITLARQGTLSARRRAIALLGNRDIMKEEDGGVVKKGTIVGKLFSELGPRYLERPGGYTRIITLSLRRLGDNGQLVLLQLIGADESLKKEGKGAAHKGARKRAGRTARVKEAVQAQKTAETEDAQQVEEVSSEESQADEAKQQ
jgi:large subunit ribosomal protein L17